MQQVHHDYATYEPLCVIHIDIVPPLTLVITPNGSPTEGQTYSLTCDLVGDESLDVPDVDNRFRWDRLTPSFQNDILRAPTLSFTPLTVADAGDYMCTNTITSPYLTSTRTDTEMTTVSVGGEHNYYVQVHRHVGVSSWSQFIYFCSFISPCIFKLL